MNITRLTSPSKCVQVKVKKKSILYFTSQKILIEKFCKSRIGQSSKDIGWGSIFTSYSILIILLIFGQWNKLSLTFNYII
jgi:uncharacterized integral membrane protein